MGYHGAMDVREPRVTAYWFTRQHGLDYGLDTLLAIGQHAAALGRWLGIPEYRVKEGPYDAVHTWPVSVWEQTLTEMQAHVHIPPAPENPPAAGITRVVHCKRESYDVLIDRTTLWGNPFRIGRDGNRDVVIAKYERYLPARRDLLARLNELRGKVLGCWCKPEACHGDVLAKYADHPGEGCWPGNPPERKIPPRAEKPAWLGFEEHGVNGYEL
jgi:uncharacterized protein DUF4326